MDVGTNTMFTITGLFPGSTNYFTATAYDASGEESASTLAVAYIVPGIVSVALDAGNRMIRVQFPVASGQSYEVQASFDLVAWSSLWLTPIQTTNGWIEYDEAYTKTLPGRYYRLILN